MCNPHPAWGVEQSDYLGIALPLRAGRIEDVTMSRHYRLLYGLALGVALLTTGLFTARAVHRFTDLRSGAGEPIRPWMSVPHIARAHHVPPQLLFETLQIPPETRKPRPIGAIARSQDRPVDQVIDDLRLAIERYHRQPPPPPAPPPRELPAPPVPAATPVPPLSNT